MRNPEDALASYVAEITSTSPEIKDALNLIAHIFPGEVVSWRLVNWLWDTLSRSGSDLISTNFFTHQGLIDISQVIAKDQLEVTPGQLRTWKNQSMVGKSHVMWILEEKWPQQLLDWLNIKSPIYDDIDGLTDRKPDHKFHSIHQVITEIDLSDQVSENKARQLSLLHEKWNQHKKYQSLTD